MTIKEAIEAPCIINKIHESCFKSYQTLKIVEVMLQRRDSHETIRQLIQTIYEFEEENITAYCD
jgi:hypothetical protein